MNVVNLSRPSILSIKIVTLEHLCVTHDFILNFRESLFKLKKYLMLVLLLLLLLREHVHKHSLPFVDDNFSALIASHLCVTFCMHFLLENKHLFMVTWQCKSWEVMKILIFRPSINLIPLLITINNDYLTFSLQSS